MSTRTTNFPPPPTHPAVSDNQGQHDLLALVLNHVDAHVFVKDAARHAASNGGIAPVFEVRITAKDGTVHQMLPGTSVFERRMIVSLQNITELRQQEEALRISEERHRFLAENARDVIWTMEPDGRISYVSPSVEAVRGFSPEEAMAQTLDQIHPPESLAVAVQWWSQMRTDLAAARQPANFRGEMAYYRKDGSLFWTEVMAYPLLHPDGSLAQVVGVTRDITEHKRAQEEIEKAAATVRTSEEHYRLLSSNMYDTVLRVDRESKVKWISPSLQRMLGYQPEEWIGRKSTDFLIPEDEERVLANIQHMLTTGAPVVARYSVFDKQGKLHAAETYGMRYLDADGKHDGLVVSFHLIDEQVAAEKELERRARTDELTSLLNRKEIFERIEAYVGKHPRTGQSIAVLFCDMDKFKSVNDTYGHAAGDEVLRVMAERIRRCLRSTDDLGARVGGDELLVVLHGVQDLASAVAVAEKLRASAAEPIPIPGGTVNTSVSIGVTLARPGEKTEALVARADDAMYRAKEHGRNQVTPIDGNT